MIPLLALAVSVAIPTPGELKTFKDWTVGCDNGRACHAVALIPEDRDFDQRMTMSVRRGPEADAMPGISFDGDVPVAGLAAGGKRLPVAIVQKDGYPAVRADGVAAVLEAIRSNSEIETVDAAGKRTGKMSLAGSSAALLYMDEQQRRVGTVTGLIRKGPRPAAAVPASPPLPIVTAAPIPRGSKPVPVSRAEVRRLERDSDCVGENPGGKPADIETSAIDGRATLVLLSCGGGAYNFSSVPWIARREGKKLRFQIARFDHLRPGDEENHPTLVNAGWDAEKRRLTAFSKGRGIGDCGVGDEFVWDGSRFRLVHRYEMGECRGSVDFITTWQAAIR